MHDAAKSVAPNTVAGERVEIRPGRFIDIACHTGTRNENRVVFFCHGSGGNKDQWRNQWQALAAEGYNLVAWDMLGHGASAKPQHSAAYAWDELVEDYLEVLRRYQSERNVLVGHSFGTGLTLGALAELERQGNARSVESVLLLGSMLRRPEAKNPVLSLPAWLLERLRPWLAKGFRERAWHVQADPALVAYEEKLTESNPLYVFKALMTQARWPELIELDSIKVDVHVVAGDSDGLTPAAGGEALARRLPNASFELLDQCGHQLMLEKPERVLQLLKQLLGSQAPISSH
ncbi:alpha/beta hydrolase [Pseudomonas syringae group sp. J309-1]|uniref:alpha/beta fold hydrolase n=1 Tax=Pseudomonas syringae group sp. J309-1 TaxID=3079588 RepID=UPI0029093145|nr:alpha/beta hydrolase [Pseudomonas syringae group sp. J309-1]MDU8357504.1 alpha/beta hydrolase [Pseudomonas syringae group sp. J309-1]